MALWNINWATRVGQPFAKASDTNAPLHNFGRATRERHAVVFGIGYDLVTTSTEGTAWLKIPYGGVFTAQPGFGYIVSLANFVSDNFVAVGLDPEGYRSFDSIDRVMNVGTGVFTGGLYVIQRRWRRRIYATANAGTTGQRARLEDHQASPWFGVASTSGAFATNVTTPAGERELSGKFFEHNGTSWVLSTDQTTPADLVSQADADYWYPGDVVYGADLNELRDRLNEEDRTAGIYNPLNDEEGPGFASRAAEFLNTFTVTKDGSSYRERSFTASDTRANVDAGYSAAAEGAVASGLISLALAGAKKFEFGSGERSVARAKIDVNATIINPLGQSYEFSWWSWDIPGNEFDNYGDGVYDQLWHEHASGTGSGTSETHTFGNTSTTPPSPWPSSPPTSRGYQAYDFAMILDWGGSGGFEYSTGSAF